MENSPTSNQNQSVFNCFSKERTKCISQNDAYHVCIDQHCMKSNPYMCYSKECPCQNEHEDCHQIRLKYFLKKVQNHKSLTVQVQDRINILMDKLIDQVSEARDSIVHQIRQGHANHLFKTSKKNQFQQMIKQVQKKSEILSGSIVLKLIKLSKDDNINQELQKNLKKLGDNTQKFRQQKLKTFMQNVRLFLFSPDKQISWDKEQVRKEQRFCQKCKPKSVMERYYQMLNAVS